LDLQASTLTHLASLVQAAIDDADQPTVGRSLRKHWSNSPLRIADTRRDREARSPVGDLLRAAERQVGSLPGGFGPVTA
jgi:hypothetical protein